MGKTDSGKDLIASTALTERSKAYGQLAQSFAEQAEEQEVLPDQARQMHAAIEASRQQLSDSLVALKKELDVLPDQIKTQATEKGQALADDLSEQAKTFFDEKIKQGGLNWIKANPWKAVGISFAVGFYIAMD